MRCKVCDYRLWNLRSRQCPECGTGFWPSEFEFSPNSVQFQCPHCGQSYYGTGAKGHLVPARFACVGCGNDVDMDEMVLGPTAGLEEEQTEVDRSPWLNRKRVGFFKGWVRTVGRSMVGQTRLMRATPVNSSAAEAWWFGLLSQLIVSVSAMSLFLAIPLVMGISAMFTGGGVLGGGVGGMTAGFAIMTLVPIVGGVLGMSVWGLLVHGILRLSGQTRAGLGRTYQAMCYSSAAVAPAAVPCFGDVFVSGRLGVVGGERGADGARGSASEREASGRVGGDAGGDGGNGNCRRILCLHDKHDIVVGTGDEAAFDE